MKGSSSARLGSLGQDTYIFRVPLLLLLYSLADRVLLYGRIKINGELYLS